jgi:uncharacterized protein (UPF0261 family)
MMMGGILPATEDRFGAVIRTRIPYLGSVGALDMVNFAGAGPVPAQYRGRNLYAHNPQITLMRTTADENARMGRWIAERLNAMEGPVRFLIPERGVSALDAPGKPFHDPEADSALFEAHRANCPTDREQAGPAAAAPHQRPGFRGGAGSAVQDPARDGPSRTGGRR